MQFQCLFDSPATKPHHDIAWAFSKASSCLRHCDGQTHEGSKHLGAGCHSYAQNAHQRVGEVTDAALLALCRS